MALVPGWRRMQGILFRPGDAQFEGRSADDALAAALADPAVQGRMREIGLDPLTGGPEEQRRLIASERAIYWPLIRELGIALA